MECRSDLAQSDLPSETMGNVCTSGAADAGTEFKTVAGNAANPYHLKPHLGVSQGLSPVAN